MNMATDEAVSEAVASGNAKPTIRFYTWHPSAVSIGYFQSMTREVNIQKCHELGIDYIRRRTGGGAVYHDEEGEITYSVVAPEAIIPGSILDSYEVICGWIIDGLRRLGIEAEFKPINDVIVKGKKISGNAQTRRGGVIVQHGTILYDVDLQTMFSILRVTEEKISDKMIKSVQERVTCILDHANVSRDKVYRALVKGFTADKESDTGHLSAEEADRARTLASTKYGTRKWNFRR